MSLKEYKRKRDFSKTSEPKASKPKRSASDKPIFVIQRHSASRLHFDLRLEYKGTLLSWAIPREPTYDPTVKRLAIKVEDHPLDYANFEGTIPKGQYGAGNVVIWDRGYYTYPGVNDTKEIETYVKKGLAKGHLKIQFHGNRLKGEFSLLEFKTDEKNTWLFFKDRDEYAEAETIGIDEDVIDAKLAKLSAKIKSKFPDFKTPMLATLDQNVFSKKGWIYEIKFDGYRITAYKKAEELKLYSRNGEKMNTKLATIVDSLTKIKHDFVMDAEIVVLDKYGISRFSLLQDYLKQGKGEPVLYAFDLMYLNGYDLKDVELIKRKELLELVLKGLSNVIYTDHIKTEGHKFFKLAVEEGLEGIIAKKADSKYFFEKRVKTWLKFKVSKETEAFILGYSKLKSGKTVLGSLSLGLKDGKDFRYIGKVGTGWNKATAKDIFAELSNLPKYDYGKKFKQYENVNWVEPEYKVKVSYTEVTDDNKLRHPVFQELIKEQSAVSRKSRAKIELKVGKETVTITHPDKMYFPKNNYVKLDLVEYYREVAKILVKYLEKRPISMHRFPNGVDEPGFFHKDFDDEHPDFVQTYKIHSKSANRDLKYLLVNNEASLVFIANLGAIEIHPWHTRVGHMAKPDYCIIDLDPHGIEFKQVVKVAQFIRELLEDVGGKSFPKTSGFTGLHIYIPLGANYTQKQVMNFLEILQHIVSYKFPDITSTLRNPKDRPNKIYLDILQNTRGQTIVAPYSVRPGEDATVSAPLEWSEVNTKLDPSKYTIKTMPARIKQKGDLWKGVLGKGVDFNKLLSKLEKYT